MPDTLHLRTGQPADALCISGLATQVFYDTYATDGMRADLACGYEDVGQTVYPFDGNDYENRLYRRTLQL